MEICGFACQGRQVVTPAGTGVVLGLIHGPEKVGPRKREVFCPFQSTFFNIIFY